jgi:oligopeptide/dipeptide ABC transporter ATP-binding protein
LADLLHVRDLTVVYAASDAYLALNSVSFNMRQGEVVGVIGESGSGKTTLGLAILRLLSTGGRIVRGSIRFRDRELLACSEEQLQALRGSGISMIFQEPDLALNPFIRALGQVEEVVRAHRSWNRRRCRDEARNVLSSVGLGKDPRLLLAYPHQLSGGERQRLVIGQALACRPALLIADEPTASLDPILQAEWLALIRELRQQLGLSLLLITHDPGLLKGFAGRALVMFAGRIVEDAPFDLIVQHPLHPYTQALLHCRPPALSNTANRRCPATAGGLASHASVSPGCPFESRCPDRLSICSHREPPEILVDGQRRVRCFKYVE